MKIDEIRIGMKASYTQTITDADIKAFAGISGDRNPAHLDEEYAKNSRYKRRISHGLLCASFFSAIFGTKLPGEGCVYASQTLKFKRPIYLNDTVTAEVEVISVDIHSKKILFKTLIKVKNRTVIEGEPEIFIP